MKWRPIYKDKLTELNWFFVKGVTKKTRIPTFYYWSDVIMKLIPSRKCGLHFFCYWTCILNKHKISVTIGTPTNVHFGWNARNCWTRTHFSIVFLYSIDNKTYLCPSTLNFHLYHHSSLFVFYFNNFHNKWCRLVYDHPEA